ncbi:MAG: hypothetical protein DYG89_20055 [Caldilinea sp. CFX5]|nr:hypothetical protein [Caldilinea sp. CFX5]
MTITNNVISWLMEGDPAIRWQTLRDLRDAPAHEWQAERQRTLESGWGAHLLALQDADGRWGGGIYSPKWTSTTYTLLTLCAIGIPPTGAAAQRGAHLMLNELLGEQCDQKFQQKLAACDRCIVGMILQVAVYFGLHDARIDAIVDNLLAELMPDGAWNCRRSRRPHPHHSSFHTTLNVLEGVREYLESGNSYRRAELLAAEQGALELLLQHHLFKSDKTGAIINPKFTMLSFPHRWHYDLLRGLAYFARADAPRDSRLQDAIALLQQRQRNDGLWPVQQKYSGKTFFEMEKIGGPSRWNTLRALRVLRWWNALR